MGFIVRRAGDNSKMLARQDPYEGESFWVASGFDDEFSKMRPYVFATVEEASEARKTRWEDDFEILQARFAVVWRLRGQPDDWLDSVGGWTREKGDRYTYATREEARAACNLSRKTGPAHVFVVRIVSKKAIKA